MGAGAGLPTRPGVLDLAFDFGAGSDAGRGTIDFLPALRLIAASLGSNGETSAGGGFVGIDGCVISTFSAPGEALFPSIRFRPADMERKKSPRYVVFCAACVDCFSRGGAGPYVLPLLASCANLVT